VAAIERAGAEGDSLGGVVEVIVFSVPPGLGSHVHWDRKLDGRLAAGLMAVPAIKGVEFGMGFELAARRSSEVQDEILQENGRLARNSNRLGGFEGGMTNGQPVVIAAAMKPISTIAKALRTVDLATGEPTRAFKERADSCAVPAAAVIGESMAAIVLAEAFLEKFGMDNMTDIRAAYDAYTERVESTGKKR
jgi:chorismate synthase